MEAARAMTLNCELAKTILDSQNPIAARLPMISTIPLGR